MPVGSWKREREGKETVWVLQNKNGLEIHCTATWGDLPQQINHKVKVMVYHIHDFRATESYPVSKQKEKSHLKTCIFRAGVMSRLAEGLSTSGGPEFNSPESTEKAKCSGTHLTIHAPGRHRQEDPWSLLANQSNCILEHKD